jgi:hypothetical protein
MVRPHPLTPTLSPEERGSLKGALMSPRPGGERVRVRGRLGELRGILSRK